MKEYIDSAAVKDEILSWAVCINHPELLSKEDTMYCIDSIPAADVMEVVRCQNCKHRIYKDMGDDIGMIGGCKVLGMALPGDFYCAHGARMDEEDVHEVR